MTIPNALYNFPLWIAFNDGTFYGGTSHRDILKRDFLEDWNASKGEEYAEI